MVRAMPGQAWDRHRAPDTSPPSRMFPCRPRRQGDRRSDHLLFSKMPGPRQEQDRHPRGAFPSKRRPCGGSLVRGRGQWRPGRQDKQWGWAGRVDGVIHLLIHENGNNAEQGPHGHAGEDLCPLLRGPRRDADAPSFCRGKKKRWWAWGY